MTPFLDLQHTIVVVAMASSRSRIAFKFDDGSRREAGPARKHENWEVVGPDGRNRTLGVAPLERRLSLD